jgi:thiamine kinase-like enzyme
MRFPGSDALVLIPRTLRALHALSPFPGVENAFNTTCTFLINQGPALDQFIQRFQAANVLPKDECDELLSLFDQVTAAYRRLSPDLAPSHNDLFKPDNILYDGNRVWLVDWEAAFQNDRYADLAVVANMIVTNDAEEALFLEEYFGRPATEYERARHLLARQVAHLFYAMGFLLGASGEPVNHAETAPAYRGFQQRFWAGEISLRDRPEKLAFGRVHSKQLLENASGARFIEALKILD